MSASRRARGFSLIEVVIFIVVLGIGIAGLVMLYFSVTRASVDPMVRKQTLALAASLLEEIELHAFTFCDPDDPNVYTAGSVGACTTQEQIGAEPGETRLGASKYDNVNDYNGFSMAGGSIVGPDGTAPGLSLTGYSVSATVANAGADFGFTADAVELVTVTASHTVNGVTDVTVSLQGYRFRYAPNSP